MIKTFLELYSVIGQLQQKSVKSEHTVACQNDKCFFFPPWNRTVDEKPKRPTRKRQAPEDFLGKGPDRKIFMGKYVI